MSVIRKYNTETQEWEVVAASSASSISVRSEQLLDEGQNETNVESVLQKLSQDVSTLKGNVSWLAENGGGGSGGGGGSVEAEIRVNGQESGSSLVLDSSGLSIVIQSKTSGLKWSVTVGTDTKTIKTASDVTKITVSTADLEKLGITKSFNLNVSALNESTLTNIYWNGLINIASVELTTKEEISCAFADIEKQQVVYSYSVGVLGYYKLYINDKEIWNQALNSLSGEFSVNLSDIQSEFVVGSNNLKARLESAQTAEIRSEDCLSRVVVTAAEPVITCAKLSTDKESRTPVYLNTGQNTVLLVPYTVYYAGNSFKAQIYSDISEKQKWDEINTFNSYNTEQSNASYTVSIQEFEQDIDITIAIQDSRSSAEYSQTFYCVTKEPDYNLLKHEASPIFSFQTFSGSIANNKWSLDNAVMTIENPNIQSSAILVSDNRSLRLQNAAYAVIQNKSGNSYYNEWFTSAIKEFTLSICYRADFHPDDDRTILQFASPNTEHTPSSGIIIRDHKLYIGQNTFDLEDQELMTITITYRNVTNEESGNVFVYINGVVEAVYQNIKISSLVPEKEKNIYIAAQVEDKEVMYYTDVSVYRVALFNKCLDPRQVLYDYLNDQAYTHLTADGKPDTTYIDKGIRRNFFKIEEDGSYKSLLYDTDKAFNNNSDNYNDNFKLGNLVTISADNVNIRGDIKNFIVPIPLMLIDVNAWTWTNFITSNVTLQEIEHGAFQYYDQNASYSDIIEGTCNVNIQGTSTLADAIKNLQITFDDDVVFVPKESWFPEKDYYLKADIVDSSHSLNTSIGKFINEEFGFTYNSDGTLSNTESWYPFSKTVSDSFIAEKKKSDSAIQTYFPKATLKHGVEGFPVFLIMRFKGESESDTGIHSMGIYQFILGRKSPRNLGYEIINSISGIEDGNITFPYYKKGVTMGVTTNKGYWIEMNQNEAFGVDNKFQELDDISNQKLTGLFWQEDTGGVYYDNVAEIKYTNMGNEAVSSVTQFAPFIKFVQNVIKLPVTNRRYCVAGNKEMLKHTFYNCTYPIYKSKQTETGILWEKQEGNNQIVNEGDDLDAVVGNLNLPAYSQYFVIAMFFGLIDNMMKNMPLKFYQDSKGEWNDPPLLGIYDTDTGLGGDNEGELKVSEAVWLSTLENVKGVLQEVSGQSTESKTNIIGQNNKLWYFDSNSVNYSLTGKEKGGSLLNAKWNSFVNYLRNKYANDEEYKISGLEDLVTLYYNKYFLAQTEGCGELLFNLTYFTKYLNKYSVSGTQQNQAAKLHGRRQQQVRRWMRNHVRFLDSVFTSLGQNSGYDGYATAFASVNTSIASGSGKEFYLTSNYPIISKINHQGSNDVYVILNKNTETQIGWGASESSSQPVAHNISYSDAIQKLGNSSKSLSSIYFEKVSSGSLPYITVFDAHNCTSLSGTDDAMSYFKKQSTNKSELREINLSETSKTSPVNYVLNLSSGFDKLQKLNLYKSCVRQIDLPSGTNSIPLLLLDIRYSQIINLDLQYQNLLTELNLDGCYLLETIKIGNCDKLTSLSLDGSQANLKSITIDSNTFKSLKCNNNKSLQYVTITSGNLASVDLTGCENLKSVSMSGNNLKNLVLNGCRSLTELNLVGNDIDSIDTLNLYGTNLTHIKYNNECADENLMDLGRFKSIGSFDIRYNNKVQYIQFSNDQENSISIKTPFFNTMLKRVYGNLEINTSGVFAGCCNFSILGSEKKYNGISMVDTDGRVKFFTEVPAVCSDDKPVFQSGTGVTNLTFNISDGTKNFMNTHCTMLDVYYVFYNIGNIMNCYSMFEDIASLGLSWTSACDNSLNRNTFINCEKVTNLDRCFYGSAGTIRIFSPTHKPNDAGTDYTITEDNGLLSPLVNCTSMRVMFTGTIYGDRFQFRRKEGNYKISNINYWHLSVLAEGVNDMTYPKNAGSSSENLMVELCNSGELADIGNFKDFFMNLPNLKELRSFADRLILMDYGKNDEDEGTEEFIIKCPATVYAKCFNSAYATGNIRLENLFKTPGNVTTINNSFTASGSYSDAKYKMVDDATFNISSGMLDNFTSLQYWGYEKSGDQTGSIATLPFTGGRIERRFTDTEFPFYIFSKNTELIQMEGFFKDVQKRKDNSGKEFDFEVEPALPGSLFEKNTKLQSVQALFYNPLFNFTLVGDGFSNCPKLQDVSYMFYNSLNYFDGSIPTHLFYHGQTNIKKEYTGANLWTDTGHTEYKYDPTVYNDDGTQRGIDEEDRATIEISYNVPIATIKNMSYCFYRCNIVAYQNTSLSGENNKDFLPLTHIMDGNGRVVKATYNDIKKTYIWEYDGVSRPKEGEIGEIIDENVDYNVHTDFSYCADKSTSTNLNFICAPDLLRYCENKSTTNLVGLFSECGYTSNNLSEYMYPRINNELINDFGLHGRIPPYFLKPVSNITDISYMFNDCSLLSSYTVDGQDSINYLIPKTFFSYAKNIQNLKATFRGTTLNYGVQLNVFNALENGLNITRIFHNCRYNENTGVPEGMSISQVFAGKRLTGLKRAFSVNDDDSDAKSSNNIKRLSGTDKVRLVRFFDNFKDATFSITEDAYIYDGFSSGNQGAEVLGEDDKLLDNYAENTFRAYEGGTILNLI